MATFQESLPLTISTELLLLHFFAHQPERGMSKEIWADLPNSKLTFFSAGSYELFEKQAPNVQKEIKKEFTIIEEPNDKAIKKSKKLGYLPTKSKTASVNENREISFRLPPKWLLTIFRAGVLTVSS